MNIDPKKLLTLISDKKAVIAKMLEIADRNRKQADGCTKLRESLVRKENPNHSNGNLVRCLEVSLAVSTKNSEDLLELAQLLLVYTQSDGFTSDVATMASKFGLGQEALREMMKAKLKT